MKNALCLGITSLLVGLLVAPVLADGLPLPPVTLQVGWEQGGEPRVWAIDITDTSNGAVSGVTQNPDGTWQLQGSWASGVPAWDCSWNFTVDPDPAVFGGFSFMNVTGIPQNFSVSLVLPAVVPSPAQMRGTIAGSLLDAGNDGAVLSTVPGVALYTAIIDGSPVKTLLDDPFLFSVGPAASGTWPTSPAAFGFEPAPPVATMIGIDHQFSLSGGFDIVTFVTRFEVIPEPATLCLLALCGLALVRRR
jgi:hypothetical protein